MTTRPPTPLRAKAGDTAFVLFTTRGRDVTYEIRPVRVQKPGRQYITVETDQGCTYRFVRAGLPERGWPSKGNSHVREQRLFLNEQDAKDVIESERIVRELLHLGYAALSKLPIENLRQARIALIGDPEDEDEDIAQEPPDDTEETQP